MSHVVSMRLQQAQVDRLRRLARRLARTPSETGALLVEEGLRRNEFGLIDFRDSPAGRQAYIEGTGLAVWEVFEVVEAYDGDPDGAAAHLQWPVTRVHAAVNYRNAFPEEIDTARADNRAYDAEAILRMLPGARAFSVSEGGEPVGHAGGPVQPKPSKSPRTSKRSRTSRQGKPSGKSGSS